MQKTETSKQPLFFYGFVIVVIGTLGVWASVPGQTMGISTFTDPVKDALGLDRNEFSLAYAFGTIASSLLLGIAGRWFDIYGARKVATFAALGLALALAISSQSQVISAFILNILGIQSWVVPFVVMIICFFFIRFAGQGVLTLASRNMIMLWFDKFRGTVNAFSSIAVSLGFSISPLMINYLIEGNGWQKAWQIMALVLVLVSIVIYLLYRDSPEVMGLKPDGNLLKKNNKEKSDSERRQFTRGEALSTRAFWMYGLMLAFNGYFVTGLTFNIVSVFDSVGLTKADAISIFVPMSIISVITSFVFNAMSDFIKLKKLLYVMILGGIIDSLGLAFLSHSWGYYMLVAGSGIMGGMFAVLSSVVWPRFYGRKNLGAISGVSMQMIVFSSALGPFLFSSSLKFFGSYSVVALSGLIGLAIIAVFSVKADNPQ
ncbi:MFS transporter [Saccharicrinis fermentans]|uniref:Phosphoglycerate transporter family protein n=1 Tax=Saccharicrinis fermentans DSM 9555 = JCM 21142 TaxID=869213 RepID=W7YAT4_9BACT|nr:MFS transporter [Saccharicrinis fermentans]GAF04693.1 phosphoglycerate transporter family protein [Saccharicrinis fermentans DSM 9555 = JCM 21142]